MIIGFLGSESGSTAASDDDYQKKFKTEEPFLSPQPSGKPPLNKHSTQGNKMKLFSPSKQSQTSSSPRRNSNCSESLFFSPQKGYVLEEQHGTVFLKASPNKQQRTPKLKMKKKKKKKQKGEDDGGGGISLEPGWRTSAANDIPRAVSYTDTNAPDLSPMLVEDYSPAVRVMNLMGWGNQADEAPSAKTAKNLDNTAIEPKKSCMMLPFFQNESLNINLFGSPESNKDSGRRYGLADNVTNPSTSKGTARNDIFGSYLKQCVPTFDSRLRQQTRSGQRKKWYVKMCGHT
jgi:hypothetical protein